jgi:hypothetical protein
MDLSEIISVLPIFKAMKGIYKEPTTPLFRNFSLLIITIIISIQTHSSHPLQQTLEQETTLRLLKSPLDASDQQLLPIHP